MQDLPSPEPGPDPVDVFVGRQMTARRQQLGMNQSDLANVLGVSFQQVQKYERGANRVSASRLYCAARALHVPVGYFFPDMDQEEDNSTLAKDAFGFDFIELGRRVSVKDQPMVLRVLKAIVD